jgi:hypothetical protein
MSDRQRNNWRQERRRANRNDRLANFELPAEPIKIGMEDGLEDGMDLQLFAECGARVRL